MLCSFLAALSARACCLPLLQTCYARILDAKRRFLEAATRYYEMSSIGVGGWQR